MEIITNAKVVGKKFDDLVYQIEHGRASLFKQLGAALQEDVQKRIKTQDQGRWAAMSKWVKAKKNPDRVLQGAEEFVKVKYNNDEMTVYGETDGNWTLTQHHEGFENKEDHKQGDRIEIDIVNPGPLGLASLPNGKFSWVPKGTPGHTPARKIWPDEGDTRRIVLPIASRWLQVTAEKALRGSVIATNG